MVSEGSGAVPGFAWRGHALVGAAGQVTYGLSNFLMLAAVALKADDAVFGAVSLVYLQLLFWTAVARALAGDVLVVRHASLGTDRSADVGALLTGIAVAAIGSLMTSLLLFTPLSEGWPTLFAVSIPLVVLHDCGRASLLARRTPALALRGDVAWLVTQALLTAAIFAAGLGSPSATIAAWAAGAAVGAAVNLARRPRTFVGALSHFGELGRGIRIGLVSAAALMFASRNVVYYLFGSLAGLVVLGDLRRALIAFAPLSAIFVGVSVAMIPNLGSQANARRSGVIQLSLVLGALACLWTLVATVSVGLGGGAVASLFGSDGRLTALLGLALVFQGINAGLVAGLRAAAAPRWQAWSIGIALLGMAGLSVALVPSFGALGAAWVLVAGNLIEAAGAAVGFMRVTPRSQSAVVEAKVST